MNKLITDNTPTPATEVIAAVSKYYGLSPQGVGELPVQVIIFMLENMTR